MRLELPAAKGFTLDGYLEILDALEREIKSAENRVGQEYKDSQEAKLLSTIPGVGPIFSPTIHSQIGSIARFSTAKQLSSFAGLVTPPISPGTARDTGG